ncbi:MAG: hypothetical protein QOF72_1277 [Blastocatellia bacterium]|nr:hypothetical protein [Blastocatellia bacterium]
MQPVIQTPKYVFRDGIEPPYFQIFKDQDNSEIIHASCAAGMRDREFPVYADEIHEMRCFEDIVCPVCNEMILAAVIERRRAHSRLD